MLLLTSNNQRHYFVHIFNLTKSKSYTFFKFKYIFLTFLLLFLQSQKDRKNFFSPLLAIFEDKQPFAFKFPAELNYVQ